MYGFSGEGREGETFERGDETTGGLSLCEVTDDAGGGDMARGVEDKAQENDPLRGEGYAIGKRLLSRAQRRAERGARRPPRGWS